MVKIRIGWVFTNSSLIAAFVCKYLFLLSYMYSNKKARSPGTAGLVLWPGGKCSE